MKTLTGRLNFSLLSEFTCIIYFSIASSLLNWPYVNISALFFSKSIISLLSFANVMVAMSTSPSSIPNTFGFTLI